MSAALGLVLVGRRPHCQLSRTSCGRLRRLEAAQRDAAAPASSGTSVGTHAAAVVPAEHWVSGRAIANVSRRDNRIRAAMCDKRNA